MAEKLTVEEIPLGDKRLKNFVKFHWRLYKGDPCWTPQLDAELLGSRLLGVKGLLTPEHPYHRHAEVTHFMAWRGKEPVGRISATINREYNEYHGTWLGFFGFFEVINDYEVASTLLDCARTWVAERGMAVLRGPGEYSNSTHERQAVLIEGFQYPPTSQLTHNPPYYAEFLERYGFKKTKDYLAYIAKRGNGGINIALMRKLAKKVDRTGIETRPIVIKDLRAEVQLIVKLYNAAWAKNWGFLPISDEEGDAIADSLRLIIDPEMVRFAYVNGEPAAVIGIIPDPNYALRPRWRWYGDSDLVRLIRLLWMRKRIRHTRGMFFGIKPEFRNLGIPAVVGSEIADRVVKKGYVDCDASLILEDNTAIIKIIELFGCRYYKRWRIYDLPLK
ncbi:MAG: hypothetical protein Q8O16_07780 [Dehalococcoidia bacterium]|nr:hypothetical protein [Dehalococcoidia bacterium]